MFYIYEHTRKDTGLPFYVGKGKGYRSASKQNRNVYWKRVVAKAGGYEIRYVAKNLDEELAYLCEQERIDQLKRLGIKLTNLTVGGEGAGAGELHHMYGKPHPQKGIKRPWLSERYLGDKNPMFGKPSPMRGIAKPKGKDSPLYGRKRPEGGGKKPHPVVRIDNDGIETIYPSVADAARSLGLSRASIHTVCTGRNKTGGGYKWKYFKEQL
jgi:hypothetical protein